MCCVKQCVPIVEVLSETLRHLGVSAYGRVIIQFDLAFKSEEGVFSARHRFLRCHGQAFVGCVCHSLP